MCSLGGRPGMDGLIDHPARDASVVCVRWERRMALWDHVRNGETNATGPRRDTAHFARRDGPAFLRGRFGRPISSNDNQRCVADEGPADELDCLRRVLAPELLRAAEARARELRIGADQVLIRQGVIDEETYLQRLAFHTGIAIENFSEIGRGDSSLRQILQAAELGLIRLRRDGRLTLAPRRLAARTLCRLVAAHPEVTEWMRLAPSSHLRQFLLHQTGDVLGRAAANGLRRRFPQMSAAPVAVARPRWRRRLQRFKGPFVIAALMLLPPILAFDVWSVTLAIWFLAFVGLRLWGSFVPRLPQPKLPRLPNHQLPVYTVIAALYREEKSVGSLMQAIDAFDYPREKLQVILALEPNDLATRAAIARLGPMPHVQVLIAPAADPQTKPKALNCALPFVQGSFTAVFDAEDRPDPGQLRAALDAFRSNSADVACAQASLCIDNNKDSWLSRTFAAEYAGQFDVFLPGLAAMRMPLPLGGSSNHFRTVGAARGRRLGRLERHRGRRPRLSPCALRVSISHVRFDDRRGSPDPVQGVAWTAFALDERLDADLGRAHARAPATVARSRSTRIFDTQYHCRRQCADGACLPDSCDRNRGVSSDQFPQSSVSSRVAGSIAPRDNYSRICVDRPDRPDGAGPARSSSQWMGSGADAVLLGLSVDRGVARAGATLARSLSVGKNRARPHG